MHGEHAAWLTPRTPLGPKRLLFLAPFAPRFDASHGGARVLAQLLTALASRHRIGLIHLRDIDEPPVHADLRDRCDFVQEVFRTTGRRGPAQQLLYRTRVELAPLWGEPHWAAHLRVSRLVPVAAAAAARWKADLIQAEYHVMGRYLVELGGLAIPRILSVYEPGAAAALDRVRAGVQPLRSLVDWQAWRRFERRVLGPIEAAIVFTERDRRALAGHRLRTPIHRIPIGTILPNVLSPTGHGGPVALFVGSFEHPPNLDAAERLIESIFPRVRRQVAGAELHIIGGTPPRRLRRRAGPGVVFLGRVPDVAPHLDRAAVVLAPLHLGGGMRVKVLDAMAAGKAVVASPLAVEGLELGSPPPLEVAADDAEFAAAVVRLLGDTQTRAALGTQARGWASEHLGWDRIVPRYEALYATLLSR